MKRYMKLPSPAMIVASAALFVALGGTSYAVATGSIDSREIKNGTIVEKDVKSQGLEGSDIKNGALAARDIKAGSLTADRFTKGQLPESRPSRWALVNRGGQIEAQSGGFSVTAAYPAGAGNGNVYINAGEDLSNNGISATIALENQYDLGSAGPNDGTNAGADANPEFAGEISASRCQISGVVECGPAAAKNVNNLVVSPRESDGSPTTGINRKKFYVVVTG